MNEEWREVPNWPEYEVSSHGRVRRVAPAKGATPGAVLTPLLNRNTGYQAVCLCRNSRATRVDIHRLVALAFLGPAPSARHLVAHNDGTRSNNIWTNLRWATQAENLADREIHGTDLRGGRNPAAKLSAADLERMRALASTHSAPLLAELFQVHKRTVFRRLAEAALP